MNNVCKKNFINLGEIEPSSFLFKKILKRIDAEKKRSARVKLIFYSGLAAIFFRRFNSLFHVYVERIFGVGIRPVYLPSVFRQRDRHFLLERIPFGVGGISAAI